MPHHRISFSTAFRSSVSASRQLYQLIDEQLYEIAFTLPAAAMDSSPPPCQFVDPRIVFGSGYGVDEPIYDEDAMSVEGAGIDLDQPITTPYFLSLPGQVAGFHKCPIQHEEVRSRASAASSPATARSSLRPEAQEFVPLRQPSLTLDIQVGLGLTPYQSHSVSPSTPRITLSRPHDNGIEHNDTSGRSNRSPSVTRSRQSSPGRRPASVTRKRRQKKAARQPSFVGRPLSHLTPAVSPVPEDWVMAHSYHPGDYIAQSESSQTAFPTLSPWPVYAPPVAPSTDTPSMRSEGYRCHHSSCLERDRVWATKSDLNKHRRKHVPTHQRPHACDECNRQFQYPKDLRRHNRAVHSGLRMACPECDKGISRWDNLIRHMASQHPNAQPPSSPSQLSAASPAASSVTSYAQSPYSETVSSTPQTLSPIAAKSATSAFQAAILSQDLIIHDHDHLDGSTPRTKPSWPMVKSYSNLT